MRRNSEEVMEEWIKIKYNYVPKYCQTWMIQGDNEEQCFVVNPEFYQKKKRDVESKKNDRTEKNPIARRTTVEESTKVGNKDKRSKFKDGTMDNEQAEGYNDSGNKNIAKPSDVVDSSQGRKRGGDVS